MEKGLFFLLFLVLKGKDLLVCVVYGKIEWCISLMCILHAYCLRRGFCGMH